MCLLAPDSEVVVITSEQPLLRGHDELRRFLDSYATGLTTYSWRWDRHDVFSSGQVAWLLAEGTETATTGDRQEHHPLPNDHGLRKPRRPLGDQAGAWFVSAEWLGPSNPPGCGSRLRRLGGSGETASETRSRYPARRS